jgi:hypothetical protein
MREILRRKNYRTYLTKFLPASLLGISTSIFQRALVDESGIITTQMGTQNKSDNGRSAWDALYDTSRNSNQ